MGSKSFKRSFRYESKALRSYWSIHIEAWMQSGVRRCRYCDEHRLDRQTMRRWIAALQMPVPKPPRVYKKRRKVKLERVPARDSNAFIAFWMMHIEALRDSGLTMQRYAEVHRLSVIRLRRTRLRFLHTPPVLKWREMRHPGALRPEGSNAHLRDKLRDGLWISPAAITANPGAPHESAAVLTRRQYTDQQKLAIVAEFTEPGVTASMIARRHQVTPSMVFRWRSEFGFGPKKESAVFATARAIERPMRGRPKQPMPLILQGLLQPPAGMSEVELADGRRVYAPIGSDVEAVRQYIAHQESES